MQVTCPNTMELFETLGVDTKISDMSFSLSLNGNNDGYEWGSRNGLSSLFAQKSNILNPSFLKMLWELNNFKGDVVRYVKLVEDVAIVLSNSGSTILTML